MASEEHRLTDPLNNAENDSESEVQEALARQADPSETSSLNTNNIPAQLKQNVEEEAITTVPNGMIAASSTTSPSSSSSSSQGGTSNDIKGISETITTDCQKDPNSVLEEIFSNVTLNYKDAPEDAQNKLPMEACKDSFLVQDQVSKMGQDEILTPPGKWKEGCKDSFMVQDQASKIGQDEILTPPEKFLFSENDLFQISEAFEKSKIVENVSVINSVDCSDKSFTSNTSATNDNNKHSLFDLVIGVTSSEKPIIHSENNSISEDISTPNLSVQSSVDEQTTTDSISELEKFLSTTTKIPSDSVQTNANVDPNSTGNFRNEISTENLEEITRQKSSSSSSSSSSCLSSLQDYAPFSSSGKICKTIDFLAQSLESNMMLALEQSPTKSASCTDSLFHFCNINVGEPEILSNSKNELKFIPCIHNESNGSFPLGKKEQCITTAVTCEKPSPTISLITDNLVTLNKESGGSLTQFNETLKTIDLVTEMKLEDYASSLISNVSNRLNLEAEEEEGSFSPTSAWRESNGASVFASNEENIVPVLKSEEYHDKLKNEEFVEFDIKPALEFQESKHINVMHNKDFAKNEFNETSGGEGEGEGERKISSTIPLLEGNSSSPMLKIDTETPEFLDDKLNESQRLQQAGALSLSSILEKDQEEESKFEEIFDEIEFNLQNSPMLRRSRQSSNEKCRRDCRFIFGDDESPCGSETELNQKPFVALRDSLDIAKLASALDDTEMIKSLAANDMANVTLIDDGSVCFEKALPTTTTSTTTTSSPPPSVSYEAKSSPPPQYHSSKVMSKKKKTSIKTEKERDNNRRVSFPEDDSRLITSYLEPVNPWYHMSDVSTDVISNAYRSSCTRHKTRILPAVLQQIAALPVDVGGRIECLSVRNHKIEAVQCESLEEIFRRVQFHTLDFENCELDDESAIPLFDMMEFYDSAIHLNISHNNKIGNRGWQACARMLKRTPSLRILEAKNTSLSEQNMPIICKALRLGTHLHTLHLENCNLTGRPLVSLSGALRLNDTVTDLYLADNRLGVNDCIQLGNLVRSNKVLKLLDLRNNNIQDSGCGHICKDIAEQQNSQRNKDIGESTSSFSQVGLTALVLWNNHITVQGVQYISLMLHTNYSLETLNLGRNNLTSEGLLLLKNSLLRNKNLRRIGLQATRIGNEGAVALAECIADNQILSRIDLRENSIQVAGLLALSRSLKINTTVIQLDLDANPRAEPSADLSDQHFTLYHEIKNLCQRNLTNDHLRREIEEKAEETKVENPLLISPEKRKISLTCETTTTTTSRSHEEKAEEPSIVAITVSESKKYRSPDPSPSVSPCPSPSLSPSPSPVPSPLKNRFKVCKVSEDGTGASSLVGSAVLSTSAPAFLMHNPMSGSLPSLVSSEKPNRFSTGGRFTVTKVSESKASFKSSLPCNRAMSSPSLIVLSEKHDTDVAAPTIVVSSPNKAVLGFNVKDGENCVGCDLQRNASLDLPISVASSSSPSSDSSSPQDDVFLEDEGGETAAITPNVGNKEKIDKDHQRKSSNLLRCKEFPGNGLTFTQTCVVLPDIQKAPLASVEGGSVDSDSEDSDLMTQSSDSTRSDEVRISVEESTPPLPAWGGEKRDAPITSMNSSTTTTTISTVSGAPIIYQPHPHK